MPLIKVASTVKMEVNLLDCSRCVGRVWDSKQVCLLLLALKIKLLSRANYETFNSRCLQSEDAEDELALNIPDVQGHVYDSGQVFAFACTDT